MTIWNLLVVICFVALYLAVSLVFLQVQKLREELKSGIRPSEPEMEPMDPSELLIGVRREIAALEERLEAGMRAIPEQLQGDLRAIQADLRFLGRPSGGGVSMAKSNDASGPSNMSDTYREARLLLSNGVDEERVVNETGLTVEEVSLLKRINRTQDDHP